MKTLSSAVAALFLVAPAMGWAYVGPGAAITLIGSALGFIAALVLALWLLISLPLRKWLKKRRVARGQQDVEMGGCVEDRDAKTVPDQKP